jgi:hypothetical protein
MGMQLSFAGKRLGWGSRLGNGSGWRENRWAMLAVSGMMLVIGWECIVATQVAPEVRGRGLGVWWWVVLR